VPLASEFCYNRSGLTKLWRKAMADNQALLKKLEELRAEHRHLDNEIADLHGAQDYDFHLRIQRLKKRKLQLKDEISQVESELLPDIIA